MNDGFEFPRLTTASARLVVLLLLALEAAGPPPALAWDRTGHLVVGRIAWEEMSQTARERAAELLGSAPADAALATLQPTDGRPASARRAEHFQLAAYWADIVRDNAFPERLQKYHRADWHWINHFFETRGAERSPYERTDREPRGRIVERLEELVPTLGDESVPTEQRAIHLAWVLHLTGDIHQPLHATARVTPTEPAGDRGGNLFELDGRDNLHWFWDSILRRSNFRWFFTGEDRYVRRIAASISAEHPPARFGERIANRDFAAWARESFEIAMASAYPPELARGRKPPASYYERSLATARRRVALAGYRLAGLLDEQLSEAP